MIGNAIIDTKPERTKMKSSYLIFVALFSYIWWVPLNKPQAQESGISGAATDAAWSPDGSMLAVSGSFGVAFYDTDLQLTKIFINEYVGNLAWSPDGKLLATNQLIEGGEVVKVWDVQSIQQVAELIPTLNDIIRNLAWNYDNQHLAVINCAEVLVYNTVTQSLVFTLTSPSSIENAVWSPDGTQIAIVAGGVTEPVLLDLWEAETGVIDSSLDLTAIEGFYDISAIGWHPDGTKIALGVGTSPKGSAPVLELASGNISDTYGGIVEPLIFVGWSPDASKFVGITDSELWMWDDIAHEELWMQSAPYGEYTRAAWKPDSSQILVIVHSDVQIFDVLSGSEISVPELPDVPE
jgi:WD40 repeat protein